MAVLNKFNTPAPDTSLTVRVDDGTDVTSGSTTLWIDLGAGYTFGDFARTASVPTQAFELLMHVGGSLNAGGGDTVVVALQLTNAEDASNPGQGNTSSLVATETVHTFAGSASTDDYIGSYNWTFDNIVEAAGADPVACRFVGVKVTIASSATMQYGAYVTAKGQVGVN